MLIAQWIACLWLVFTAGFICRKQAQAKVAPVAPVARGAAVAAVVGALLAQGLTAYVLYAAGTFSLIF